MQGFARPRAPIVGGRALNSADELHEPRERLQSISSSETELCHDAVKRRGRVQREAGSRRDCFPVRMPDDRHASLQCTVLLTIGRTPG